jgi:regulator of ribonuclease activity A
MNLGVMALGTHPFKTEKRNEGQENLRLRFSGLTIEPGDYLYADEDGILLSKELLSL